MSDEELTHIHSEDIELNDLSEMLPLERRDFLKVLGGGIFIFITLGETSLLTLEEDQRRGYPTDFNAYLRIDEDGKVAIFTGKIEMGQGVHTSLAQMAAEDLAISVESIDMVMGDTDRCPYDSGTYGSLTTRMFGPALRAAAAEAREVLLELASERLGTPVDELSVEDGVVFVTASRRNRITYGQLAEGKQIARTLGREAVLKSAVEFSVMGKPWKRLDAIEKVKGEAKFAGDTLLPGLLYARILRPPAHGATLLNLDTSEAERLPGVIVVKEDDMVAVLHRDPEAAEAALQQIKAEFDIPEAEVDHESIFDHLLQQAPQGRTSDQRGSIQEGESISTDLFEETYLDGYVAHSPIEPHTSAAEIKEGKATIWASTQSPFPTQAEVARVLGFSPENVRVITPFVGGGFGGKTSGRQSVEAARLADITGKPVLVAWSRAEEFFFDTFRPAAVVKIKSGIDSSGRISLWDYHVYYAGSRGSDQLYDAQNNSITVYGEWRGGPGVHPFGTGAWRAPGANTNVFAKESQLDIMAAAAKIDPLKFRLNNSSDERLLRVLKSAAERFGWSEAPAPSGRGYGIACGLDAGTYVAHIAEVEVDERSGRIQVKRVVCAQDMGIVVNPDGARMQMEGCITMGMGYALTEDIRFRGGEILDRNWDTYELPRFSWLPEIETVLVKNDELSPQGGGEPAIIGMGAVIANAVFDAAGARLHQLPMTPERVREAIRSR